MLEVGLMLAHHCDRYGMYCSIPQWYLLKTSTLLEAKWKLTNEAQHYHEFYYFQVEVIDLVGI